MSLKRLGLVPVIATLALLTTPGMTLADCMQPPPIQEALNSAQIVFVGTVTSTTNRESWATVRIAEVWKGPDQPVSVLVKGGPDGNAATSVDRTYQVGVQYLFFPLVNPDTEPLPGAAFALTDNACTSTTPWSDGLAALRPSDARAPLAAAEGDSGSDFGGLIAPLGVALLVAAVLLLVGLAARGRQAG